MSDSISLAAKDRNHVLSDCDLTDAAVAADKEMTEFQNKLLPLAQNVESAIALTW